MRLELSRRARADLDDIADYGAENFGTQSAVAYIDAIEQAFSRLLRYPESGPVHPAVRPPLRSLACERHRIFYSIDAERVRIERILHAAMDVERHL